ncbi:MAG: hypothetical protein HOP35_06195 [Nitrospira sp.]|nr:hypothetical protein [Nitrospira sp.]
MNWKTLITLLLLLPIFEWYGLPPLQSTVEIAEYFILLPEESHCKAVCVHPSSLVDPPQASAPFDIPYEERVPHEQLIALLPHHHTARDRPPSLLCSTSHSLRAPPTLILA